jgi:hypothetical protein
MKTEAHHILDTGATPAELAAELCTSLEAAEYIAQQYRRPQWLTWTPEQLERLPAHLRQLIEANNPNHRKPQP